MGLLLNRRRMMMGRGDKVIMTSASNPEVMAICYAQGWCASPDRMTQSEAEQVTDIAQVFRASNIVHFDEFEYFTGVTSTQTFAFANCSELVSIQLPPTLVNVGTYLFYQCYALNCDIDMSNVRSIGFGIFFQCTSLQSVSIPEVVSLPKNYCFGCTSLQNISIPNSILSIEDGAFSGCSSLAKVNLHEGVERIGDGAFQRCVALKELYLPQSISVLGKALLAFNTNLESLTLPPLVSVVPETIAVATGIKTLYLPQGITQIDGYAFGACNMLAEIKCDAMTAPPMFGDNVGRMPFSNGTGSRVPAADRKLIVPIGATGYDTGDWLNLQTQNGYQLIYE